MRVIMRSAEFKPERGPAIHQMIGRQFLMNGVHNLHARLHLTCGASNPQVVLPVVLLLAGQGDQYTLGPTVLVRNSRSQLLYDAVELHLSPLYVEGGAILRFDVGLSLIACHGDFGIGGLRINLVR